MGGTQRSHSTSVNWEGDILKLVALPSELSEEETRKITGGLTIEDMPHQEKLLKRRCTMSGTVHCIHTTLRWWLGVDIDAGSWQART